MRRRLNHFLAPLYAGALLAVMAGASPAWADLSTDTSSTVDSTDDPLHGFCYGNASCQDNGSNTPTSTNPPDFGFTISPSAKTGDLFVDILIPNNEDVNPSMLNFGITGTQGGANNNKDFSGTAAIVGASPWTSGNLADFLGFKPLISGAPNNPIGAFLSPKSSTGTLSVDPGATGYYVYQANLGTQHMMTNTNASKGPLLKLNSGIAKGSYIVAFLGVNLGQCNGGYISTANSGAIFETSRPVPEPASALLLAGSLLGLGLIRRAKTSRLG